MTAIKKHILIVEDSDMLSNSISAFFSDSADYRLYAVDTVAKAKDALINIQFDIMITDVNLGNETPEEIIELYLKQSHTPKKIIVQSGLPSNKRIADKYGVRFLSKPYTFRTLLAVIKE